MSNFSRGLVVTHSKVHGQKKAITSDDITTLEKETWAKILARLNHLAHTRKNYTVDKVLNNWFGESNKEYSNGLLAKIIHSYVALEVNPQELITINIWSNLTLLDKVLEHKNIEKPLVSNDESERRLFDIYIAINEEFGLKSDDIFKKIPEEKYPNIVDRFARSTLTLLFPYHDINHFTAIELLVVNFIKAYYCFKFLEKSHPELLKLFLLPYKSESWQDYLKAILPVVDHAITKGNDSGLNYLSIEHSPEPEKSKIFLDFLSLVDQTEYIIKTDFLHARAHPLFKTADGSYLIMDAILIVNRVYNSIFFEILRLAEKNKKLKPAYKDFFSEYTTNFIEKYLGYTLLEQIFENTRYYRISGDEIKTNFEVDTEPDYYVRNGNKIFLFEIKGSFITGDSKQSFSYDIIEPELKLKFLYNDIKGEKKAILQLVERIVILFEGKASYDPNYKPSNIRIYPILVFSEIILTTPGVSHVFNNWFWEEIEKHEILKKNKHRIYDLVLIDIDTLILYTDQFKTQNSLFESTILEYYSAIDNAKAIARIKIKANPGVNPKKELERLIMGCLEPFNRFIKNKIPVTTPRSFLEFGYDILK
ncbi:MAG TPA: hypothetical protein DIT07_08610 [Sphingobacteriaceae bacterium]|nr:hypothetical protein [Sphingobacteriaceae bacterium]